MRRTVLTAAILTLISAGSFGFQQAGPDPILQERLQQLVQGFRGDVGIYVRHLGTGQTAGVDADTLFPTASMVKVPILLKVFDRSRRGDRRGTLRFLVLSL